MGQLIYTGKDLIRATLSDGSNLVLIPGEKYDSLPEDNTYVKSLIDQGFFEVSKKVINPKKEVEDKDTTKEKS